MLENINTADWGNNAKQVHIFVCHEEIRQLRVENNRLKQEFGNIWSDVSEAICMNPVDKKLLKNTVKWSKEVLRDIIT